MMEWNNTLRNDETEFEWSKPGNTEQGELSQNIIQRNLSTVGYQVIDEMK
jgi:hypothetical protein